MAHGILIIAESGAGKSTSIENLDPAETFIINVANKPLPFKGWRKSISCGAKIIQQVIFTQVLLLNR